MFKFHDKEKILSKKINLENSQSTDISCDRDIVRCDH